MVKVRQYMAGFAIWALATLGSAASEEGQLALQKLSEGHKLSTLSQTERRAALQIIKGNFRVREGLLNQIEVQEADAALLKDAEFKEALSAPDPDDHFVLSFDDEKSTFSRYSIRFQLEMDAPLIPGFGGPCYINYSVRPRATTPEAVELVVALPRNYIKVEDAIPGNKDFEVFRLSQDALDKGTTITEMTYDAAAKVARVTVALPQAWAPVKARLGEFLFRGQNAGSSSVEFVTGSRSIARNSGDAGESLFTNTKVEVLH